MKYSNHIIVLFFSIILSLFSGCVNQTEEQPVVEKEKPVPVVDILKVKKGGFMHVQTFTGTIKTQNEVEIISQGQGKIKELSFEIGDEVREKEVLLKLDTSSDSQVKVNYENLQTTLDNTSQNYELTDALTKVSVRDAESRIEELEIALKNQRQTLENTKITAQKNIESAKVALENTETQYELTVNLAEKEVETAKENKKNFLESSTLEFDNLLDTIVIDHEGFLNTFQNNLETVNSIIGEEDRNNEVNDAFERYLGVLKKQAYIDAKNTYRASRDLLNEYLTSHKDIEDIKEKLPLLLNIAKTIKEVIDNTDRTLVYTITSIDFPQEQLDGLKATIDNLQSGQNNINVIINQIQNYKQQIENLEVNNENQISILDLAIERAEESLQNAKQALNDEEATSLRSAKKQLELAEASAKSQIDGANAQIESIEKQLENSNISLERAKKDRENALHGITEKLDDLKGNLQLAKINLDDQTILSPIKGTVITKEVDLGDEISQGTLLGIIADIQKVIIQIDIPSEEVQYVRTGEKVTIEGDKKGIVKNIYPSANPQSKKFTVEIELENSDKSLRPGSFVRVFMTLRDFSNDIFIPLNAMKVKQNSNTVYVLIGDTVQEREIQTGEVVSNMIEIENGLDENSTILIDGLKFIEDGMKVKVNKEILYKKPDFKPLKEEVSLIERFLQ